MRVVKKGVCALGRYPCVLYGGYWCVWKVSVRIVWRGLVHLEGIRAYCLEGDWWAFKVSVRVVWRETVGLGRYLCVIYEGRRTLEKY